MYKNRFSRAGSLKKLLFLVAMFLCVAAMPAISSAWTTQDVGPYPAACNAAFPRTIAYSGWNNSVHIVCGGDVAGLRHYVYNGTSWLEPEPVDTSAHVGKYASIAVNMVGKVFVSYYDENSQDLKFASNATGPWVNIILDSGGDVGMYSSIAVEPDGTTLHISYYDATNGNLKYKKRQGLSWLAPVIVDQTGTVGLYSSIALDKTTNLPRISYLRSDQNQIKFATRGTSSWLTPAAIASVSAGGGSTSLAIDSSNYPHISYYSGGQSPQIKHIYKTSAGWRTPEIVDSYAGVSVGNTDHGFTSIAIDSSNKVHISYQSYTTGAGRLMYKNNTSGSWPSAPNFTDDTGDTGWFTSIAEKNGRLHISYAYHYPDGTYYIRYATGP